MSNVAEGCAPGPRVCAIDQQDAFSGFGQRPGNGTAHNASTNDGNIVPRHGAKVGALNGGNIMPGRQAIAGTPNRGNMLGGRQAVPAVANHGDFVLAHLRLAHRGS
jgi:hypothetical protein